MGCCGRFGLGVGLLCGAVVSGWAQRLSTSPSHVTRLSARMKGISDHRKSYDLFPFDVVVTGDVKCFVGYVRFHRFGFRFSSLVLLLLLLLMLFREDWRVSSRP